MKIKVGTFITHRRDKMPIISAYTKWYNSGWTGCKEYEIEAKNGEEAKKLAVKRRRLEEIGEKKKTIYLLSDREREVMEWVCQGKSTTVIAQILGISIGTVLSHKKHILQKFNVVSMYQAVYQYSRLKLKEETKSN